MFISSRIKSFKYAFQGFAPVFKSQANIWIHSLAAIIVVAYGFYFSISKFEWIALCLVIGTVFICEFINSAIETLCDYVSNEKHDAIKKVKDISAAAVLISAIVSVIVGCIIFIPKIINTYL